ncbi:hypothetical protein SESBI_01369 [Sesbania bispinosa]|nr:hypothetical protein SESBI_01369 [Sesbania bispinosa]
MCFSGGRYQVRVSNSRSGSEGCWMEGIKRRQKEWVSSKSGGTERYQTMVEEGVISGGGG